MSDEQERIINETVENLKHLDKESLLVIKAGAEVLRTRDALDNEAERDKKTG